MAETLTSAEEFLNELTRERSLPEYTPGAVSAYTSALTPTQLELNDDFEDSNQDWALSPTAWPQVQDVVSLDSDRDKHSGQRFITNPISLVRLDELREYISQYTTTLRFTDEASKKVKLAAEEHMKELQSKYEPIRRGDEPKTPEKKEPPAQEKVEEEAPESDVDPAQLATLLSFPQMIESANFPRVLEVGTPLDLPNNVNAQNILSEALKSRNFSPGIIRRWKQKLLTKNSLVLFTSSFWYHLRVSWDKLTEYSPQLNMRRKPQESDPAKIDAYKAELLSNTSKGYVKLFLEMSGADKDDFFMVLPDLLSQAVVNAYIECFPRSTSLFDNEQFRKDSVDIIFHYVCGIKPFKIIESWPKKEGYSEIVQDRNKASGSQTFQLQLVNQPKNKKPSMVVGPNYTTNRIHFDVYGNSPVVSHYLRTTGAKNERKRLTIHRSEVVKDYAEDETLPTYRQLVAESLKNSRARDKAYEEVERNVRLSNRRVMKEAEEEVRRGELRAAKLLQKQELVKEMSTQVVESQEARRKQRLPKQYH